MRIGFKYGKRISVYEYHEGAKSYSRHITLSDEGLAPDDICIDLDNPDFDKLHTHVKTFNKNREFYSNRFYDEMRCEEKIIENESHDERTDSAKNLLNLYALCDLLITDYGFEMIKRR